MPSSLPSPTGDPAPALLRFLIGAGHLPAGCRFTPLTGGRTNRLWRADNSAQSLVVKLYGPPTGNPLFPNDPNAETQLLAHLDGSGLAPCLEASLQTPLGPVLIYRHIEGRPWQNAPGQAAHALHRIHQLAPPSAYPLPRATDGSQELAQQTHTILSLCPAETAEPLRGFEPRGHVPASGTAALLHGDPVPGNILQGPEGLWFIDWQCPALGDPAQDLAIFLSPAMQKAYRGRVLTLEEEAEFLDAYPCPNTRRRYLALAPWFHWRMAAYCLWRDGKGSGDNRNMSALELARITA